MSENFKDDLEKINKEEHLKMFENINGVNTQNFLN